MRSEDVVTINPERIVVTDIIKTGRNKAMSFLSLNLNISHFHIDIRVKRDEEKRKEKIRRLIEHEKRLNDLMEQRNKIDSQFMRINM
jgi:hypothetical protein